MCSVIFVIDASKPRPASTETASRSSASGSAARIVSRRAFARAETMYSGTTQPPTANAMANRNAMPAPPSPPRMRPKSRPPSAAEPLIERNVCG